MAFLGELVVKIAADTAQFVSEMQKGNAKMKEFGEKATAVGKGLATSITLPLLAIGAASIAAFGKQADVVAKLESAIRATGKETSISAIALQKYAAELQDITTFGDEASIAALALTQQLADLNENQLKAILPRLQDFSIAMGVDLQTAASLMGKTIGSSTNALSRYGIEIDTSGTKTEKLEQLLVALDEKFLGTAEAVTKIGIGPLIQFQNTLGDVGEEIGGILMPLLNDLITPIKEALGAFQDWDDESKELIVTLGIAAAAIPILIIVIGQLSIALSSGVGPISLIIVALGIFVAAIGAVSKAQESFNNRFKDAAEAVDEQREQVGDLLDEYDDLKKKTDLSEEAQRRLEEVIKDLSLLLPIAAVKFDEYGNAIDIARGKAAEFEELLRTNSLALWTKDLERAETQLVLLNRSIAEVEKERIQAQEDIAFWTQRVADAFPGQKQNAQEALALAEFKLDAVIKELGALSGANGLLTDRIALTEEIEAIQAKINELDPEFVAAREAELALLAQQKQATIDQEEEEERLGDQRELLAEEEAERRKEELENNLEAFHEAKRIAEEATKIVFEEMEERTEIIKKGLLKQKEAHEDLSIVIETLLVNDTTKLNAALKDKEEEWEDYNEAVRDAAEKLYDNLEQWTGAYFDALGQSIVEGKLNWDLFKEAIKDTISALLVMLAREAFVRGMFALALPFGIGSRQAVAWFAAAAAARLAASIVSALAEGAIVEPTQGGTLARIGEGGSAEAVLPLTDDVMGRLANRITANMQPQSNIFSPTNNINLPQQMILEIGGEQFNASITDRISNGQIRVAPRGISQR